MEAKKIVTVGLAAVMAMSLAACGSGSSSSKGSVVSGSSSTGSSSGSSDFLSIEVGKTDTDLKGTVKFLTNRTDMLKDDYNGTSWKQYIEAFNKVYPNITIDVEGLTDYANDSLTRLQGGDWGDVMMIPAVVSADLPTYFEDLGSSDEISKLYNYTSGKTYQGEVYGIPITATTPGFVYNKKVFEQAGITSLPTTVDDFLKDLQAIKDKTDAITLYTNYAAGWTNAKWDDVIGVTTTGDADYLNQKMLHTKDIFSDPGDGTGAYNVYKALYDAVKNGCTEDDFSTTDWESSKTKLNNGEIGCMMLGSWAVTQMQGAGDHPDDVGFMAFPMTVNGKQYVNANADYSFGINPDSKNLEAANIWVKWMTEQSNYSANEGGLAITKDGKSADFYKDMEDAGCVIEENAPAKSGEEDLLSDLNSESELNIGSDDGSRNAKIIEAASDGSESLDDIMKDWNDKWNSAVDDLSSVSTAS